MNRMAKAGGALCAEGAKAHPPLDNISMNAPTDLIREFQECCAQISKMEHLLLEKITSATLMEEVLLQKKVVLPLDV